MEDMEKIVGFLYDAVVGLGGRGSSAKILVLFFNLHC